MKRTLKIAVTTIAGFYFLALLGNLSESDAFVRAAEEVVNLLVVTATASVFIISVWRLITWLASVFVDNTPTKTGTALRSMSQKVQDLYK